MKIIHRPPTTKKMASSHNIQANVPPSHGIQLAGQRRKKLATPAIRRTTPGRLTMVFTVSSFAVRVLSDRVFFDEQIKGLDRFVDGMASKNKAIDEPLIDAEV